MTKRQPSATLAIRRAATVCRQQVDLEDLEGAEATALFIQRQVEQLLQTIRELQEDSDALEA